MRRLKITLLSAAALTLIASGAAVQAQLSQTDRPRALSTQSQSALSLTQEDRNFLLSLLRNDGPLEAAKKVTRLERDWKPAYITPSLEMYNFVPQASIRRAIIRSLTQQTGQPFGDDLAAWDKWRWNQAELKVDGYDDFKAEFYVAIDPAFGRYFQGRAEQSTIRLDEVKWGGVRQDGIPPLRGPKMITASQASYLDDDNIVFGIEVNGDARAYPKRILAWHEMFVDTVGGVPVTGVYCTLCGTVILYDTPDHEIGTSGFLYRSNKLMYDKATQSLWNTLKGEPVIGPLVGKGISLDHRSVVTTTWGAWKARHPQTQVLSLDTGHRRDYGEGVAYHNYFATDDLMFKTPYNDQRLKNKDEVLALRFKSSPGLSLAISVDYLKANPIYTDKVGDQSVLVLTDKSGANRVYDPKGVTFTRYDGDSELIDSQGQRWRLEESRLTAENGSTLGRLPYHRAFWFGWHAAYPNSRLVK